MTATIAPADVDSVVKRADASYAKRHGDDPALPEYVKAIADAVRPLLGQPGADTAQVQRLDDLVTELRKTSETRGGVIDRQASEIAALKKQLKEAEADAQRRITAAVGAVETVAHALRDEVEKVRTALTLRTKELDEARAERDIATAKLREQGTAPGGALELARADNARLADQLACALRDLRWANNALDEEADAQEGAPAAVHVHQYLVLKPGEDPQPCECGKPCPRTEDAFEVVEPEEVHDVEPWAEFFGRMRYELEGEWPK